MIKIKNNSTQEHLNHKNERMHDELYYFTMAEVPSDIEKNAITHIDFDAYLQHIKNPLEIRRIDHTTKPVFAIVFAKTTSVDEIKNMLRLDMHRFIFLV